MDVLYYETTARVPAWLYDMPEAWWESYFDKVDDFAISYVWGNA